MTSDHYQRLGPAFLRRRPSYQAAIFEISLEKNGRLVVAQVF
jgi:hypothetical protein